MKGAPTLEKPDKYNNTPLANASLMGATNAVKWLLSHGVKCETASCKGRTALDYAQEQGHTEIAAILVAKRQEDARKLIQQGQASCRSGNLDLAQQLFGRAAAAAERAGGAHSMMEAAWCCSEQASYLSSLGKYEQALVVSKKGTALDRSFWGPWDKWGATLDRLGRYAEAATRLKNCLACDTSLPHNFELEEKKLYINAVLSGVKMMAKKQRMMPVEQLKARGNAAFKTKDYAQAIKLYTAALTVAKPTNETYQRPFIRYPSRLASEDYIRLTRAALQGNLAQCFLVLERFEEAKICAETSCALADSNSNLQVKATARLLRADTALAHKRLAVAKALHNRLGDSSFTQAITFDVLQQVAMDHVSACHQPS